MTEHDKLLYRYLKKFNDKNKHSEIHHTTIDGVKYFIKVVGKTKKEHMKNEIETLKELSTIFPMYNEYLIAYKEYEDRCAIMLKYIEGEDLKNLLDKDCSKNMVLSLYRMLFTKLKIFMI